MSVEGPVFLKPFGGKNQYPFVFKLEILNNRQCFISFSKTDAIGKDAPVVFEDFVYSPFDSVLLKVEQGLPYFGFQ